ncbi:MAG: prepilin peptidase [Minisyncoccales bacterium]
MDILFWYVFVSIFAVGMIIGSFLNCLIWRSYNNESALAGRSYCPNCRHKLAWFDLIPAFSFLFLRAKCRYCEKPISWQYPAVELATGILFVAAARVFAPGIFNGYLPVISALELLAYWVILSSLVVVFVADLRWYFIPDGAIAAGIFGAAVLMSAQFFESNFIFHRSDWSIIFNPLLSGLFAALFFLAVFLVSRGKWIGFGDVKYALLMGLALGFPETLLALFLANFFGAIIGLGLIAARRKKMSSEIPFGPFLVGGTLIALFFPGSILNWYLSIGAY